MYMFKTTVAVGIGYDVVNVSCLHLQGAEA